MEIGSFFGQDHLNQHSNPHFSPPQICCPNCGTNFGEMIMQVLNAVYLNKPPTGEEVVEKAMNRVMLAYLQPSLQDYALPTIPSSSLHQAEPSASRSLLLKFKGSVPDGISTWTRIEEESGSLEVELVDEFGKRVEVDPEFCVKIKADVLEGDFDVEDEVGWTDEDYNRNIAKPRDNKGALLKGKSEVVMTKGAANVSHLAFTDNSSTRRNKKFRLGARVVKGLPPGVVVKTAVSEAFRVKDRRQEGYKKRGKPSLMDDIWCLVNIRKDGVYHKRAQEAGINTVKDFLQCYHADPKQLQDILVVHKAKLRETVENAEACELPDEHYKYYNVASGDVLVLDCAFNIVSVTFKGQIDKLYKNLDKFQKDKADDLRRSAYKKRNELEKIDVPVKQTSGQELTSSCVQGQGQQQPAQASGETVVDALLGSSDVGRLMSNQMHIISPTHVHPLDATAAEQAEPVEPVNCQMTTLKFNSFGCDSGQLEAFLQDPDLVPVLRDLWASPQQQEEDGNAPQVAAHDHVTSKLLAACYVTKAASLFMISVQQDLSAPSKKRKLQ